MHMLLVVQTTGTLFCELLCKYLYNMLTFSSTSSRNPFVVILLDYFYLKVNYSFAYTGSQCCDLCIQRVKTMNSITTYYTIFNKLPGYIRHTVFLTLPKIKSKCDHHKKHFYKINYT